MELPRSYHLVMTNISCDGCNHLIISLHKASDFCGKAQGTTLHVSGLCCKVISRWHNMLLISANGCINRQLENGAEQSVCFRGSSCADSNLEMVEMRASLAAFSTSPPIDTP